MTNSSNSSTGYWSALYQFGRVFGAGHALKLLVSLILLKLGGSQRDESKALLTSWAFFRDLRRAEVKILDSSETQFRVACGANDPRVGMVRVALRMPPSASSDPGVFSQIFIHGEYLHVIEWFASRHPEPVSTILDLGANIGCASLFFGAFFAGASIFCLEPEKGNFERLRLNLDINPNLNIRSHRAAIWTRCGPLRCVRDFRDCREYSFRFVEAEQGDPDPDSGVEGLDVQTIVGLAGFEKIDFLKLDVEGGEAALLRDPSFTGFLGQNVTRIAVEVHEEFISVSEAKAVLESQGFQTGVVHEFVVGIKPPATGTGLAGGSFN